jgi:hypothetical protein
MNYSWFIILIAILISIIWNYKSATYSLILILITKIIYDINLFSSADFKNGNIQENKLYYKQYKGNLADIYNEIIELKILLKRFGLLKEKVYRVCALYIHSVVGSEKVFKNAYLGIMRYKKTGYIEVNVPQQVMDRERGLEEYLFENQYNLVELPKTKSIWSSFDLRSEFSVYNVVNRYYSYLNDKISKSGLPIEVNHEIEASGSFVIMELYSDNDVNFHIPIDNLNNFRI